MFFFASFIKTGNDFLYVHGRQIENLDCFENLKIFIFPSQYPKLTVALARCKFVLSGAVKKTKTFKNLNQLCYLYYFHSSKSKSTREVRGLAVN